MPETPEHRQLGVRQGGHYTILPKETFERMELLLAEGILPEKIAAELKCGRNTVYRHRDRTRKAE